MSSQKRNSSIELLRIIIMFMILLLHANFLTFGVPQDHSLMSFSRCVAEAFTITPVNIFVLITGFFGTSFSIKKVAGLVYQLLFCLIPISILLIACHVVNYDLGYFDFRRYWFINAYIGLVILSPALNAAVEHLSQRTFKLLLIFFYAILFIDAQIIFYGINVSQGYSLIWFVFLYMLGRYIRLYTPAISTSRLVVTILVSCLCQALVLLYLHREDYVQPFIVIQSVSTLLLFSKYEFHNRFINTVASSVAMVYLFNLHPILLNLFRQGLQYLYQHYQIALFLLITLLFCLAIFVCAIIYDRLRHYTWKKILLLFNHSK